MAVRFDASTDRLTGGGVTGTVATVVCWFRVAVDRGAFSNAWVLWNSGTTGVEAGWGTNSGGTQFLSFDSAFSTQTGPDVVVGTWYCMALVCNGTSWTLYYGTDPASLTTVGPDTRAAISSPGGISVSDPADWLNGDIACFKVWARALSAADVEDELSTYSVVDSTSLVRTHTFQTSPGTTNGGGSGGDLTAGSTSTATSTGPAALDVLTGGATSATTISTTATAVALGTVTSTTTTSATATAQALGTVTSSTTIAATATAQALGTVTSSTTIATTATAQALGTVTSSTTIAATATGATLDVTAEAVSTTTIAATVTARLVGEMLTATTVAATVTARTVGTVSSTTAVAAQVAAVDLTSPALEGVRFGAVTAVLGLRAGTVTTAPGLDVGTVSKPLGVRAGTVS